MLTRKTPKSWVENWKFQENSSEISLLETSFAMFALGLTIIEYGLGRVMLSTIKSSIMSNYKFKYKLQSSKHKQMILPCESAW